jgi:hypothetical protein
MKKNVLFFFKFTIRGQKGAEMMGLRLQGAEVMVALCEIQTIQDHPSPVIGPPAGDLTLK